MSVSSESASSQYFYEVSDGEGAVASSSVSEEQDKRKRNPQNLGKAWVLRGEITQNMIHNNSDQADIHGDVENDAKVQIIKSERQAALGAKFEWKNVKQHHIFRIFLQSCQHSACWACSNKSQDSNPGFPPNREIHNTDCA